MIFFRKINRGVAVFFIVTLVSQLVFPTMSFALTSGPSAPEFSSFEPVDTTDMVNLATGEFVYNTPLLEVPGPEGGYPLSLSYHAGIKQDQEASWVGLGWTLNPGAVTRTVDGYADDNAGSKREVRDYWAGGTQKTKSYQLGISVPNSGISFSFGIERVNNSYKGFSENAMAGISFNMGKLGNTSLGFTTASNGTGGAYLGDQMLTNRDVNNSAGRISSFSKETKSEMIPLPFGSFSLREYYTRFWSDETQALTHFGTLYPGLGNTKIDGDYYSNNEASQTFNSHAFDIYDLYDGTQEDINVDENEHDDPDAAKQLGGTLPAYDRYEVTGQGISGMIQPYIFENGDLYGQSTYERSPGNGQPARSYPILGYKTLRKFSNKKVDFRFTNDFSNSLQITASQVKKNGDGLYVDPNAIQASADGFNNNELNQKLAGSKHVEWFTNEEIVNGTAKEKGFSDFYKNKNERKLFFNVYENYMQPEAFIPYSGVVTYGKGEGAFITDNYASTQLYKGLPYPKFKSIRPTPVDMKKKIGGFMITNESGVTYHYALPVYNYNEYTRSKLKKPQKDIATFREYKNNEPYAYTWLLTAVTGPDYVDKDGNGRVSDGDTGYWVNFDYGRWADSYQWRTPFSGYLPDLESEYETFSYGIKELYYLDAIETRTHKAIFIKSKRKDGKGVTSRLEGGSNPRGYIMHYKNSETATTDFAAMKFGVSPVSTMKLDAVYLFDKNELANVALSKSTGGKYMEATSAAPHTFSINAVDLTEADKRKDVDRTEKMEIKYHNGDLVYDDDDIKSNPDFRAKALKVIEFNTDYSLSKGMPNSFGYFSDAQSNPKAACTPRNDCTVDPNYDFDFEWPAGVVNGCIDPFKRTPFCCGAVSDRTSFYSGQPLSTFGYPDYPSFSCSSVDFKSDYRGSSLEYVRTGKLTLKSLTFLGQGGANLLPPTTFTYNSNNPNYITGKYDEWGYYKSDFDGFTPGYTHRTTEVSSALVDAWSLKTIHTPLGATINIDYEAQQYSESVFNDFSTFSIQSIEKHGGENSSLVKIMFKEKGIDLSQWFKTNQPIDLNLLFVRNKWWLSTYLKNISDSYIHKNQASSDMVIANGGDYLIVDSPVIVEKLRSYLYDGEFPGVDGVAKDIHVEPYFIAGFAKATDDDLSRKFAGGIRVKALSMMYEGEGKSVTEYSYTNPGTNISSGVTSFKPYQMTSVQYPLDKPFFDRIMTPASDKFEEERMVEYRKNLDSYKNSFLRLVNSTYLKSIVYNREAPPPGAIYEYVTVKNKTNSVRDEQYTTHHFKVFKEAMVARNTSEYSDSDGFKRNVIIKNNSYDVGSVLNTITYDLNNQLLKTVNYGYLYDDVTQNFEQAIQDKKQGIINQTFHKYITLHEYKVTTKVNGLIEKIVNGGDPPAKADVLYEKEKAVVTTKEDRVNMLTSIEEIDHKTGIATRKENHSFDFYSGKVTKELSTNSYGQKIVNETIPAYTITNSNNQKVYEGMGLKIFNTANRNMLIQPAASYSYSSDASLAPVGLLSASVQTWSDQIPVLSESAPQTNIWRKQSEYSWNGLQPTSLEGSYPMGEWLTPLPNRKLYLPFNFVNLQANSAWEKQSHVTLYDVYSHALESKDINGTYVSSRMDPQQQRVIASATNASYNQMGYSGAEYSNGNTINEGGISRGEGSPTTVRAHTGDYSLLVDTNKKGFTYSVGVSGSNESILKYKASVWVYAPGEGETQSELNKVQLYYAINDVVQKEVHPIVQKNKSKNWYLLELNVDAQNSANVTVGVRNLASRGVNFDDFRIHPLDGTLTSYVYDRKTRQLSYLLDGDNFYTHYEYDKIGRLVRTSRELLNFDFGTGKESYKADQVIKEMKYNYGHN